MGGPAPSAGKASRSAGPPTNPPSIVCLHGVAPLALAAALLLAGGARAEEGSDLAVCEGMLGGPAEIVQSCSAAIESGALTDAQLSRAFNNRCAAEVALGRHDRAIADCDRALALDASLSAALVNRGNARDYLGSHDRAIADYDRAIALRPDFAEAWYNRASAFANKRDYARAIADYGEALRLKPDFDRALHDRARAQAAAGEFAAAIADYGAVVALRPLAAEAFYGRALAWHHEGDYDQAVADYDRALALRPDNAAAWHGRAAAQDAAGRHDLAVADYDRALALDPALSIARYGRGQALFHAARFLAAAAAFEQAAKAEPGNAYRQVWLYLARWWAGLPADPALRATARRLDLADWPGPVIALFLDAATPADLLRPATPADRARRCEAAFYVGQLELMNGALDAAARLFEIAVESCERTFGEHAGARVELARMDFWRRRLEVWAAGPGAGRHP